MDKAKVENEASWLGARLREKSTYAGLAVIVSLVFPHFAGGGAVVEAISEIGMGIGGLLAVTLPENGSAT